MFPTFYEKMFYTKKISPIFRKIFSPGGNFRKNFPRGFSGDPRENFRKFPKFPEIPGKFRGYFGVSRLETRITPLKLGNFFPEKGVPRKKFPGFSGKVSPGKFRKFPEIPGNFPPNFPGGSPRGSLGRFRLESRIFGGKFGRNLVKNDHFSGNCVPRKFPKMTKISGNFPEKWPFLRGLGCVGYWFPEGDPPKFRGKKKKSSEKKSVGFFLFLRFFEKKRVFLSFRFGTQGRPSKFPDFFSEKSTKKWPKISRNFPPGISGNSGVDFGKPLCNDVYTTKNRVKNFPEKPRKNGKKSEKNFAFFFPNFSKKVMFFNVSALQRLINVINLQFSKSENSIKIYKKLFFDKILYNVL